MALPSENCYWAEVGSILAGEYPGAKHPAETRAKLRRFLDCGITFFLDLTEPGELAPYESRLKEEAAARGVRVSFRRMPIRDVSIPSRSEMRAILDTIESACRSGQRVYVHCWGGVGRTGTVMGCLFRRQGMDGEAALAKLAGLWKGVAKSKRKPFSPETEEQRAFVRNWKEPDMAEVRTIKLDLLERFQGCLLGLAVGDALGTTVEFKSPGSFPPLGDMVGGGPFGLAPGQWTDDTSMALCLAASLVECKGFNAQDQMERYVRWWKEGYFSSTGRCFDIGNTVRAALARFLQIKDPFAGSTDPHTAGNGSLMRLAPVPMFYAGNPAEAIKRSGESSRTTHAAVAAVDACRYYGGLIAGALAGASKEELLSPGYSPIPGYWTTHPLVEPIAEIAAGSFKRKNPPAIRGTGYVVQSLEAALWAFQNSSSFAEGALKAVNLGEDADTTGAIYGQLAGAYYGRSGIPADWVNRVAMRERIESLAAQLSALSGRS